jgi:hypothetical protein
MKSVTGTSIQPGQFTSPIQVVGAFLAALVLVEASTLGGAAAINDPVWVRALLSAAAVLWVPLFIGVTFLLLTRFRPQIQQDPYYNRWLDRTQPAFRGFQPENLPTQASRPAGVAAADTSEERDKERKAIYRKHEGLFLVHTWRPSAVPDQVADIVIELYQHNEGPLTRGEVESVEYQLGPKFFTEPVVKTNAGHNFRLEVSAYGPMLCLARVRFLDDREPLDLQRYINF